MSDELIRSALRMAKALRELEAFEGALPGNIYSYSASSIEALLAEVERVSAELAEARRDLGHTQEVVHDLRLWADLVEDKLDSAEAERDVWMRRATVAETDADRLAMSLRVCGPIIEGRRALTNERREALRLHDEAVASRD